MGEALATIKRGSVSALTVLLQFLGRWVSWFAWATRDAFGDNVGPDYQTFSAIIWNMGFTLGIIMPVLLYGTVIAGGVESIIIGLIMYLVVGLIYLMHARTWGML